MLGVSFPRRQLEHEDRSIFELGEAVEYSPADDLVSGIREEDAAALVDWLEGRPERTGVDRLLEENIEVAPGFRREPKPSEPSYTEQIDIFERDPSPGEKRDDPWHSPLYEREEYEPEEYRHALVA